MNTKRIFSWGGFVLVIGLIVWGLIAASNKADRESASIANVDKATSADHIKGATSTNVTLIEYSDFQCPGCASYYPLVEKVLIDYSSKISFVYRHFPLTQHKNAIPAAKAAEASGKQGKFWEMYSKLFETQLDWQDSKDAKTMFAGFATELGLDIEKFNADYESKEISEKIDGDLKSGIKAGVNSTPTFYLNGKKISPQSYDQFKTLLDQALTPSS